MYNWYLPTLSELIREHEPDPPRSPQSPAQHRLQSEREWSGAIAALNTLLQQMVEADRLTAPGNPQSLIRGVVLSGSLPVLTLPGLVSNFSTWTLTAAPLQSLAWMPLHLLPAADCTTPLQQWVTSTLPLLPDDPLAAEQFCLVLTADFSLVMALGEGRDGRSHFMFSFNPELVRQSWGALRSRLLITQPQAIASLDPLTDQFAPVTPDYRTITQFSRLLLTALSEPNDWQDDRDRVGPSSLRKEGQEGLDAGTTPGHLSASGSHSDGGDRLESLAQGPSSQADVELLKAIAHEVRTPLTTIRTLTRLLLKRKDLNPDVLKRLDIIDQECTEQIDRFGLIFRAVEFQSASAKPPLTPPSAISLAQVFQQNIPRWQQQASQRNLTLDVSVPGKLPLVLADSSMLDQMLTGVIDRIIHSLPPGSHIKLRVKLAGHQLKLQFQPRPYHCNSHSGVGHKSAFKPTLKSLGELLMFQPETGSLSLNLAVTKSLFQALGGKLIVRNRPEQGEELTVFLPLETTRTED